MIVVDDKGFCRGKTLRDGIWAYGGYSYNIAHIRGFITNVGIDNKGPICWMQEVHPATVGRFSGLYDATKWEELSPEERELVKKSEWKGRPIFEGDILEAHYDEKFPEDATRTVVVWRRNDLNGIGLYIEQKPFFGDPLDKIDASLNKVIGNIHENPELLEEMMT